jgi:aminoglycoside 3-N-acetyltransferase
MPMAGALIRKMIPSKVVAWIRRYRQARKRARVSRLPKLSEQDFGAVLRERLQLKPGDVVFVHSSTDGLNLSFSPFRLLPLLLETVGPRGTLLFPTYPKLGSAEFLSRGEVFDIRKTPSYMGLLTELARRHPGAMRSLHPTKSVCAIGPLAEELTAEHQLSPYPYDRRSPYYKLIGHGGKIIGLGLSTVRLSFAHCADDALREEFPVAPYLPTLFQGQCLDRHGQSVVVATYAHDMSKMNHDVPSYVRRHVAQDICSDFEVRGMPFFLAHAAPLFERMLALARQGITIYPRSAYNP